MLEIVVGMANEAAETNSLGRSGVRRCGVPFFSLRFCGRFSARGR